MKVGEGAERRDEVYDGGCKSRHGEPEESQGTGEIPFLLSESFVQILRYTHCQVFEAYKLVQSCEESFSTIRRCRRLNFRQLEIREVSLRAKTPLPL